MTIDYNNYLVEETHAKFTCHKMLTDIQAAYQYEFRYYYFDVTPDYSIIRPQADMFAMYITTTGIFENTAFSNISRMKSLTTLLSRTYIYSYVKSVVYAYQRMQSNTAGTMGPNNNLVFYGHKMLHDIINEGCITSSNGLKNVTNVEVRIEDDPLEVFKTWEDWPEIFNESTGQVYNSDCELVLMHLKDKYKNIISVDKIGQSTIPYIQNLFKLPVGNLLYSSDMQQILFLANKHMESDRVSFYWGKAVCLTALSVPFIDADDNIYHTTLSSGYDVRATTFEVEAITGYSPTTTPLSGREISGRNPFEPTDDTLPPSSGNSRNWRPVNPRSKPAGNRKETKLDSAKGKLVKFTNTAVDVVRRVDSILENEQVQIVAGVISDITGKNIRPKSLKKFIGQRIGSILEQYGIEFDANFKGSPQEYDYFYGEASRQDGRFRAELVGSPRKQTYQLIEEK